jgi:hypothetical protein
MRSLPVQNLELVSSIFRSAVMRLLGLTALLLLSCAGGGGKNPPPPEPPAVTAVSITPKSVNLKAGAQQQFTALVSGTGSYSSAVNWFSAGGAFSGSTNPTTWTAPLEAGTCWVEAKSSQDSTKSDMVFVTVTASPVGPVGSFTSTGSMAQFRSFPSATLLPNGRVLVAGGVYSSPMVELFNPNTGLFSAAGTLVGIKDQSVSVLLNSGKVLLLGATFDGSPVLELYDPATQQSSLAGGDGLGDSYSHLAMAPLANGEVLLVDGVKARSFVYEPASNRVSPGPGLDKSLGSYIKALALMDGRVLVTDGMESELYQPSTGSFRSGPKLGTGFYSVVGNPICLLPDGRVLAFGNVSSCFFNPGPDTVTSIPGPFPGGIFFFPNSLALLPSGRVLLHDWYSTKFWVFDPSSQQFMPTPDPIHPERFGFSTALLPSGGLLITGGQKAGKLAEIYR